VRNFDASNAPNMFTRKKIALFLLTAGITAFGFGIYYFYDKVAFDSSGQQAGAQLSAHWKAGANSQDVSLYTSLLITSIMLIGVGSYLVGVAKRPPTSGSLTLDFTKQVKRDS
jgi:hypothetical protein